jgi:hypothetical protein
MKKLLLALAGVTFGAIGAHAGECESTFVKRGNPVTGLRFTAKTSVRDLSPASAIGQLRGVVAAKGYDIVAAVPEAGNMVIEQPMTGSARSFPIEISATQANGTGIVRMTAKLRPTMMVRDRDAAAEMCGILAKLKGGKQGLALASKGGAAKPAAARAVRMSVLRFSAMIGGESARNTAAINQRYRGKAFTLFGPVAHIGGAEGSYRIDFKLVENQLTSLIPGSGYRVEVSCMLAPDQAAFAMQLSSNAHVEVTGTFDEFDLGRSTVYLSNCRRAR